MIQDAKKRLSYARASLEGLSVGDAFGEQFFGSTDLVELRIRERKIPPAPWPVTDDTIMAKSIVDILAECGSIQQDALATRFGRRYLLDPARGYGGTAHSILRRLASGESWKVAAYDVFDGSGSMGNGGAMRAAPIGAFFQDSLEMAAQEARLSAEVTHAHLEGQAGAIAVAVAAAYVAAGGDSPDDFFDAVLAHTPRSETRDVVANARTLPKDYDTRTAVAALGNGSRVISQDTVPFALWCAAHNMGSYENALWRTVSGLGDRDTTCAIVGGILGGGSSCVIPPEWAHARESLVGELLAMLQSKGGSLDAVNDDGFGLLHAAAEVDRSDVVSMLVQNGLNLEARAKHGHTPLQIACALGHKEAATAILNADADPLARTNGLTARDIAVQERKPQALEVLDRYEHARTMNNA